MFNPIKVILFSTDLSENCRPAFEFALAMAIRNQATLVLLHVVEKMPDYVEGRLKGLLGQKQWKEISESYEKSARETLIGKRSTRKIILSALEQFCSNVQTTDGACEPYSRQIAVRDGDVVEEIIKQSEESKCDMIVLGARRGILNKTSIGIITKGVITQSKIPVVVVPSYASPEP